METRLKKRPHFYVYNSSCSPVTYLVWSWVGRWGTLRWRIGRRFGVVLLSFFCLLCLEIIEDVGFGVVPIQCISELQDIEVVTEVTQKIVLVHTDVKVAFDEVTGACCRISLRNIICREIFSTLGPDCYLVDVVHGVGRRLPLLEQHLSPVLTAGLDLMSRHHLRPGSHGQRRSEVLAGDDTRTTTPAWF